MLDHLHQLVAYAGEANDAERVDRDQQGYQQIEELDQASRCLEVVVHDGCYLFSACCQSAGLATL